MTGLTDNQVARSQRGITSRWPNVPLSRLVGLVSEKGTNDSFKIALENIESWTGRFIPNTESLLEGEGIAFEKGDLLFGKLRPYLAKVWVADRPGAAVGDFHVYRPKNTDVHFLKYLLLNRPYIDLVNGSTHGVKMPRASWSYIRTIEHPLPTMSEQQQIASYLDRETGQIDELIAKQERLIELLAERLKASITLELERDYPSTPIKLVADLIQTGPFGSQLHANEYINTGIPLINPMHLKDGRIVPNEKVSVASAKARELSRHELRPGDLVIARRGELGRAALVPPKTRRLLCGTGSAVIRPTNTKVVPAYLYFAYTSEKSRSALSQNSLGSTMDNLNSSSVGNLRIPLPPIADQRESIQRIELAVEQIGTLSKKATRAIELLKERRQALISAAVTGKINVREM